MFYQEETIPCHISTDRKNRFVFVSNYSGGNLSAIAINADGSLSNEKQNHSTYRKWRK